MVSTLNLLYQGVLNNFLVAWVRRSDLSCSAVLLTTLPRFLGRLTRPLGQCLFCRLFGAWATY